MGAKYSHGVWEQFADHASTILEKKSLNFFMAVQTLPGKSPTVQVYVATVPLQGHPMQYGI